MSATAFDRERALSRLGSESFDLLVVGGGITGAGVALDSAARGLRTALVERRDFASGTRYSTGNVRVIRARDVADAVLGLIETYMSADVRRNVSVCSCCRKGGKAAFG